MIGPISGDMSMAPMMVAVEFTFRPTDAIMMANIRTHRLVPLTCTPDRMLASITSCGA